MSCVVQQARSRHTSWQMWHWAHQDSLSSLEGSQLHCAGRYARKQRARQIVWHKAAHLTRSKPAGVWWAVYEVTSASGAAVYHQAETQDIQDECAYSWAASSSVCTWAPTLGSVVVVLNFARMPAGGKFYGNSWYLWSCMI